MHKAIFGLLLFGAMASASTTCTQASLQTYIDYGMTGCTAGLFTMKDFTWDNFFGTVPVSADDVIITPVVSGSSVGITFSGIAESTFSVAGEDKIKAMLSYYIDPPPPILDDFSLSMNANSPVAPGTATIDALVCAGARFTGGCTANGGTLVGATLEHVGAGTPPPIVVPFPMPVNQLDVRLTIELLANGSTSQITGGSQVASTVPEPGAALLAGAGLLGLAGLTRIRRSRAKQREV